MLGRTPEHGTLAPCIPDISPPRSAGGWQQASPWNVNTDTAGRESQTEHRKERGWGSCPLAGSLYNRGGGAAANDRGAIHVESQAAAALGAS